MQQGCMILLLRTLLRKTEPKAKSLDATIPRQNLDDAIPRIELDLLLVKFNFFGQNQT